MINTYAEVLSVDQANACVEISPATPMSLNLNDRVLLIQMQGAVMSEINDLTFGNINFPNGAGLYEIATVCDVTGTSICFQYDLVNTYNPLSATFPGIEPRVQLVTIPSYVGDVNVVGALTGAAWNGITGGVLIFEATGTITLNDTIDMSGKGFRGGDNPQPVFGCVSWLNGTFAPANSTDFFYDLTDGEGAEKGEGIAGFISGKEAGKGRQTNGGGGGNDHNSGGGGGSNYNTGGQGGIRGSVTGFNCYGDNPGIPGVALSTEGYSLLENNIFMGGGGGSGHDNDGEGAPGGNGGGIIIITADQIDGNGNAITANGDDALASGSDGAPGGGGGGVILINSNTFSANPLTLEASGGNGGNSSTVGVDCMGPGGGGGGGVIWTFAALPGTVTTDVSGGVNGIVDNSVGSTASCPGNTNGASAGLAGAVLTALDLPEETVNSSPCILAPQLLAFAAVAQDSRVQLDWQVADAADYQAFEVERSVNGVDFEEQFTLSLTPASQGQRDFAWTDRQARNGTTYYRLRLTDHTGAISYSDRIEVQVILDSRSFQVQVFPNPASNAQPPYVEIVQPTAGPLQLRIQTLTGQGLTDRLYEQPAGTHRIPLEDLNLPAGTYLLSAQWAGRIVYSKLVLAD